MSEWVVRSRRGMQGPPTALPVLYSPRNAVGAEAVGVGKAHSRSEAPMILGLITSKDVFRHAPMIVRGFGAAAFLRCCLVIVRRRHTTFLECIFPAQSPARLKARGTR